MSDADREKWNGKYADRTARQETAPDAWLIDSLDEIEPGRALDLACGLGDNAIQLAEMGWQVDAVDVSDVGLAVARELAAERDVTVNWIAADLDEFTPIPDAYDLVLVFRFLDRVHLPQIVHAALKPGGMLFYETFLRAHLDRPDSHLRNPAFALEPDELPQLFSELDVVEYREIELPDHTVARFVGRRSS